MKTFTFDGTEYKKEDLDKLSEQQVVQGVAHAIKELNNLFRYLAERGLEVKVSVKELVKIDTASGSSPIITDGLEISVSKRIL